MATSNLLPKLPCTDQTYYLHVVYITDSQIFLVAISSLKQSNSTMKFVKLMHTNLMNNCEKLCNEIAIAQFSRALFGQ